MDLSRPSKVMGSGDGWRLVVGEGGAVLEVDATGWRVAVSESGVQLHIPEKVLEEMGEVLYDHVQASRAHAAADRAAEADVPRMLENVEVALRVEKPEHLQMAVNMAESKIKGRRFFGCLGVPAENPERVRMIDASHLVTALRVTDGKLYADIEILDTSMGRTMRQWLARGSKLRWVPAGLRADGHPPELAAIHADSVKP